MRTLPSTDPRDRALRIWAAHRGLLVQQREHWDAISETVLVEDSRGDEYEVFVAIGSGIEGAENTSLVAGATLVRRGTSKHRAFRRERDRFTFRRVVPPARISEALDEALNQVRVWVANAGHSLPAPSERNGHGGGDA